MGGPTKEEIFEARYLVDGVDETFRELLNQIVGLWDDEIEPEGIEVTHYNDSKADIEWSLSKVSPLVEMFNEAFAKRDRLRVVECYDQAMLLISNLGDLFASSINSLFIAESEVYATLDPKMNEVNDLMEKCREYEGRYLSSHEHLKELAQDDLYQGVDQIWTYHAALSVTSFTAVTCKKALAACASAKSKGRGKALMKAYANLLSIEKSDFIIDQFIDYLEEPVHAFVGARDDLAYLDPVDQDDLEEQAARVEKEDMRRFGSAVGTGLKQRNNSQQSFASSAPLIQSVSWLLVKWSFLILCGVFVFIIVVGLFGWLGFVFVFAALLLVSVARIERALRDKNGK